VVHWSEMSRDSYYTANGNSSVVSIPDPPLGLLPESGAYVMEFDRNSWEETHLCDAMSGEILWSGTNYRREVKKLEFCPATCKFVAAFGSLYNLEVWNMHTGESLDFAGTKAHDFVCANEAGTRMVTRLIHNLSAALWNLDTGEMIFRLCEEKGLIDTCFALDDHKLVCLEGSGGCLTVWDIDTARTELSVSYHFSGGRNDGKVKLSMNGALVGILTPDKYSVLEVASGNIILDPGELKEMDCRRLCFGAEDSCIIVQYYTERQREQFIRSISTADGSLIWETAFGTYVFSMTHCAPFRLFAAVSSGLDGSIIHEFDSATGEHRRESRQYGCRIERCYSPLPTTILM
jgi:hypothetical protein